MSDGIGMVKMLLGLPGMDVLEVVEGDNELVVKVETTETVGWCPGCGSRAQAQDRTTRSVRDLSCFGRAVRLEVWCRRWRCREALCATKTWTENVEALDATAVLTRRAGAEACRQVGQQARPVAAVAREFGVCWWTVMNAVIEHGTPLVDTPDRVGMVAKLGVDETSFQAARPGVATKYVTGLVDLERRAMIDMTPGNRAADLRRWCANADPAWLAKIEVVATDLAESYRAGLSPHLDHCVRVADPFHVVRVANRCMDTVRRRVQNEQLGHYAGGRCQEAWSSSLARRPSKMLRRPVCPLASASSRWRCRVGRNSMVVTKHAQDSQIDSKWQSSSTGRAQWPLPSRRWCISRRSLSISLPSASEGRCLGWL